MSADNVTPMRPPQKAPREPREPRKQKADIAFSGPGSLRIWHGLHGVCRELWEIDGNSDPETVSRYGHLAAAAAVLADLMDERLMLGPDL